MADLLCGFNKSFYPSLHLHSEVEKEGKVSCEMLYWVNCRPQRNVSWQKNDPDLEMDRKTRWKESGSKLFWAWLCSLQLLQLDPNKQLCHWCCHQLELWQTSVSWISTFLWEFGIINEDFSYKPLTHTCGGDASKFGDFFFFLAWCNFFGWETSRWDSLIKQNGS